MFQRVMIQRMPSKFIVGISAVRCCSRREFEENRIGMREIVGYGRNGEPSYIDSEAFPYPSIRFQEITPVFKVVL